jgi:tRNA (guanosine-2'-O-)-methyltransferase
MNPSNVWACLRTIEAFGIQHVDVVIHSDRYKGKAALSQKRGMRTAMGAAQWLTLVNHRDTASAIEHLRATTNCRVYAADVSPSARDIRTIDWDSAKGGRGGSNIDDGDDHDRPVLIVMGNEDQGISDDMRALADECFTLPMSGFAESFNLSVATAITLAYLSAASGTHPDTGRLYGPIRPGDLAPRELDCLFLKGLLTSLPQTRMADAILKTHQIDLPRDILALL